MSETEQGAQATEGHTLVLPIAGVPTEFWADDAELLGAAEQAFGAWRSLESRPDLMSDARVRVRLWRHEGSEGGGGGEDRGDDEPRTPFTYRVPDPELLLVSTPGSFGVADQRRGESFGYVTRELSAQGHHFVEGFVAALTLYVVTAFDRRPFHAAAVGDERGAVLLFAPGGTGKSTLAWACGRRGLAVLSDDTVQLQTSPRLRVWGVPGPVYLPEESRRFFGRDAEGRPRVELGGRTKVVLQPRSVAGWLPLVERATVCVLSRNGRGPASLEPIDADRLLARLREPSEPGFDLVAEAIAPALERLAEGGGWQLELGDDPDRAAELVEQALNELAAGRYHREEIRSDGGAG